MKKLELCRGLLGVCQLIRPQLLYRTVTGTTPSPGAVVLMRVLGARHVVQALLLAGAGPTTQGVKTWHRCGALVDLAHAATMVALACGDRRWRRPAGIDAALALAFSALEAR
ncbi:hypothetical protein AOC05_04380 [Arthrobacter alpinus]|uniref:Uncharacterized protein n=1 Tax=Arthrobacter alpinus TaxID=656366 RepID=A0A0M4RAA5_9MICC|nr:MULTISPECIES: hypothetical protein [Arthrobacter]ALE91743.1 hypothetical protein AOC05_04380 [Arthrobacter alpinus]